MQPLIDRVVAREDTRKAAHQLVRRMIMPTGISGWFQRLVRPKYWDVGKGACWLSSQLMAGSAQWQAPSIGPDGERGTLQRLTTELKCHVGAAAGSQLIGERFHALDEKGRQRWIRRVTAEKGAFAKALTGRERDWERLMGDESRKAQLAYAERLQVELALLRAMRDVATGDAAHAA